MDEKTFYVTKAKLKELEKEHEELVLFENTKVLEQEAPRILDSEDLNSEFVSYHEDMDSLRLRINELQDILEHYALIKNPPKGKQNFIGIGAKVSMDINGKNNEFTIMGTLEANPVLGMISNESPVGKAILGHKVGDEIVVELPEKTKYKIKSIKYQVN